MKYLNIREEELKNKIAQDYFWLYDCTKIIGNVDFCVSMLHGKKAPHEQESLLWAEAKKGASDIYKSIVQLVLTIGKARTFDKYLPPAFLGAFDAEKMAFIPYNEIQEIFYMNDFNWNVAPSNQETKEFKLIHEKIFAIIDGKTLLFNYIKDDTELKRFIKSNFADRRFGISKTKIDKNNFTIIYNKWLQSVKPTISVNWEKAKKKGIMDGDFYLADLLSFENKTLKEKLFVLLNDNYYEFDRIVDEDDIYNSKRAEFSDRQVAHTQFWNRYERPPKEEYWNYIIERRDLLVPQDIRERKGSFFTPSIWVELSQKYLADLLGENWQEEYYVWDCAAGTGNLLVGLTNKYNIWASTLDKADVDVMKDRIQNGANLLESHVFQFDFLNDDFSKLPQGLQNIINDEKKRKKLVIYINPPYAEGDNVRGIGRKDVQVSKIHSKYQKELGKASGEIFAQFFARIFFEIPSALLAEFSTLKILQAPNFENFRLFFKATLKKMFVVPARTFDNVNGQFPIGFMIWNTNEPENFKQFLADVYYKDGISSEQKSIVNYDGKKYISDWLEDNSKNISKDYIGHLASVGNDFQNQRMVFIDAVNAKRKKGGRHTMIATENIIVVSIYFAVRKVIPASWLNDREQFLYPNDGWKTDHEFQNDCIAYTLFNNNIQSKYGTNHWIPFTEYLVCAHDKFESHFMTDFMNGKEMFDTRVEEPPLLLFHHSDDIGGGAGSTDYKKPMKRVFSETAKTALKAGLQVWKHYHKQPNVNVNASLYDIREHFQKRNDKGVMNNKSEDDTYNKLMDDLRSALKDLADKIEPKIYAYDFLKK
ncbi:MAG: hypothetical protein FWC10_03475 [Lentimicrobiaceae bacterium]|nr:hypothetical protein [Lentimicrobiaceae bacterium]